MADCCRLVRTTFLLVRLSIRFLLFLSLSLCLLRMNGQRTLAVGERITVKLVYLLTGLDLTTHESMLLFVCTETTESKPVKPDS